MPPFVKVLWYIAESVVIGVGWKAFDYAGSIVGIGSQEATALDNTWRRFVHHWEDGTSGEKADDQAYTIDIANITGGNVDGTWTQADYDAVFGNLLPLAQAIALNCCARYTLTRIDAYIMGFNDYTNPKPFAMSGAPEASQATSLPGAGSSASPPQTCTTITEETPVRAHWGRFYSPTIGTHALNVDGRILLANVNALAQAAHDNYEALMTAQFFPVVPVTQSDKQPLRALQAVTGVRVDDVVDVQRSRRHKYVLNRKILPLPTVLADEPPAEPAGAA